METLYQIELLKADKKRLENTRFAYSKAIEVLKARITELEGDYLAMRTGNNPLVCLRLDKNNSGFEMIEPIRFNEAVQLAENFLLEHNVKLITPVLTNGQYTLYYESLPKHSQWSAMIDPIPLEDYPDYFEFEVI